MKKGIIKLFAAVVMLSAMIFAVPAANAEGEIAIPDSDLTYTLVDGTLTISGTGDMPDWSFAGAPWYDSRDSITAVVIEEGVTSIGGRAFYSCDGLESITIPTSVTSIGDWAFYSCDGLESVTLPEGVTSIGYNAFFRCGNLESITIPEGVTSIGSEAFSECIKLASVMIPASVTSIGGEAFCNCGSLLEINVDEGNVNYSSINGVLFNKDKTILIACPGGMVGAYEIPQGVISIDNNAFANCDSLESVTPPEGVTSIGDYAFRDCNSLESVTIPESVTSIGRSAFIWCGSLTSIDIPASVTSIGDSAFSDCDSLRAINVDEGNANYSSVDGVLFNKDQTILIACPDGMVGACEIPQGVTSIGDEAFSKCDSLESITIPEGVTDIGNEVFRYCRSLESITIPASIANIGDLAFSSCRNLSTVRYTGTSEQWSGIAVGSGNDDLLEAQMIFKDASAASAELVDEYTSDTGNANEDAASLWELSVARDSETVSSVGVDVTVGGGTQTKTIDTANVEGDLIFGIVVNKHQADISYIDAAVNGTSKYNVYTAE